ncbi:MAG TPA: prolyl oligopeptidase family serine peptidase [Gemmatimonadales bacterium]|nr:prolyl oligopeptidase family serine peptidase [Gemmatimonadales bacterium]
MRSGALVLAAVACLTVRAAGAAQERGDSTGPGPSLRDIIGVAQVIEVQLSPDGKRVVYEVRRTRWASNRYVTELWLRSTDARGTPVKLVTGTPTTSAYQSLQARWSPDSRRLAYFSDRDGSNQIWLLNPDTRATERLTRLARWQAVDPRTVQPAFFRWSPDSRSIAFAAFWPIPPDSARDPNTMTRGQSVGVDWTKQNRLPGARTTTNASLWLVDIGSRRVRRLTDDSLHVADIAWSPDGSRIALSAGARPEDVPYKSDLYVLDVRSRAMKLLLAQPGWDAAPQWSPDGRWIAFESQRGRVDWNYGSYLAVLSPEGGEPRYLAPGFEEEVGNWPHLLGWAADSRSLYLYAYVRLGHHVYRAGLDGAPATPVTGGTRFLDHFSLAPAASAIAVTVEDPVTPPDVYLSPLEGFAPRRLTDVNPGWAAFPKPRVDTVSWRSRDGRFDVEGLLIRPSDTVAGARYPLLVFLEGGPSSVRAGFQLDDPAAYPLIAFANKGYLVFAPGSRGRPGYGAGYRQSMPEHSDFLPGPFEDVMAGVDHLIRSGMVDSTRMGVMGFSYGGALSAYTITHTDRFRAASINEGPANFLRYAVTVAGQRDRVAILHDQAGFGSPWHPDSLRTLLDQSGIFRMDRVRTPTLLEFGFTSLAEPDGIEMYGVLQRFRVPSALVVYPRTGHGIEEPFLREDSYRRNVAWFDYWVRGRGENPLAASTR